jgi:predicted nucleic acid-binding protein
MRIFVDSAIAIYIVEQPQPFYSTVDAWLKANPGDLIANELVRMETLVLPTRNGQASLIQDFEDFFANQIAELGQLHRPVLDGAVQIRAANRWIKSPDAIHFASAIKLSCDVFVTNDLALKRFNGIRVEVI